MLFCRRVIATTGIAQVHGHARTPIRGCAPFRAICTPCNLSGLRRQVACSSCEDHERQNCLMRSSMQRLPRARRSGWCCAGRRRPTRASDRARRVAPVSSHSGGGQQVAGDRPWTWGHGVDVHVRSGTRGRRHHVRWESAGVRLGTTCPAARPTSTACRRNRLVLLHHVRRIAGFYLTDTEWNDLQERFPLLANSIRLWR